MVEVFITGGQIFLCSKERNFWGTGSIVGMVDVFINDGQIFSMLPARLLCLKVKFLPI